MTNTFYRKIKIILLCAISCFVACTGSALPLISSPVSQLQTKPNFHLNLFANTISAARELALGAKGTIFVGSGKNKVYALAPNQNQSASSETKIIADHLNQPAGIAFADGNLYVATENKILRFDNIESNLDHPGKPKLITTLPKVYKNSASHYHYLSVGPDDKLYVSIPAPCDHCAPNVPFASIIQINKDNGTKKIFAKGIRDSLGFDWQASDHSLWFTDIGELDLGAKLPPATINQAKKLGTDFGFPYFYGKSKKAAHMAFLHSAKNITAPSLELPAHVQPMGIKFYSGRQFPEEYHNQLLVVEHGPATPGDAASGHQIILVTLKDNKAVYYQPFVWGFHTATQNWGDPVDLLNMADGSILISDDKANSIYRLSYSGPQSSSDTISTADQQS